MSESRPILVIGAGPTGLTAAIELSRFGIPVRIVDALSTASTTSRALAIQARTMELMEQRGLAADLDRLGNHVNATSLYGGGKLIAKVMLSGIESRYNSLLLLAQSETERVLAERLVSQGVGIERASTVVAIGRAGTRSHGDGRPGVTVVVRTADGTLEQIDASYVIASDGAHSIVRRTLGVRFEGKSHTQKYALADVHVEGDLPEKSPSSSLAADFLECSRSLRNVFA